jgi:hypothetical protein
VALEVVEALEAKLAEHNEGDRPRVDSSSLLNLQEKYVKTERSFFLK